MPAMNLFAISSILTAVASFGFGLSVYGADRSSKVGQRWFVLSLLIGGWALGLYGVTTAGLQADAELWQVLLDSCAIFIPLAYLRFVTASLKIRAPLSEWLAMAGAMLLLALSCTPLYKIGTERSYLGFYWIHSGPLYFLFPVYYVTVTGFGIILLFQAYRRADANSLEKGQILNHIIAAAVGFSGGVTNFLPQLFNLYPFGNYFVILYVALMSYAVLRYRFFNIKIVSTQLFAGGLFLAALFNLFDSDSQSAWLIRSGELGAISIFSILLVNSVRRETEQRELIEQQKKDLELINHQQENLLHFITHEVKGFLTKGQAAFSSIVEGDFEEPPPGIKNIATLALADMRSGVTTVTDILSAADLKHGSVVFKKNAFDMTQAVRSIVEELAPRAEGKGLKLSFMPPVTGSYLFTGDEAMLRDHVFRNLIDNAINYTLSGTITVDLVKTDSVIRFSVKDTGVGISTEDKARLFTEGGHGKDSIKVNVNSTGYGLFIAKKIVDAHNGTIRAESDGPGTGARFIVELPIVSSQAS